MKIETRTFNILATFALALLLVGCASITPGNDTIVVRAEQTLSVSFSTFDTFLRLEHSNTERVKKNAPKVHQFAEWLREKDAKGLSRWVKFIQSANTVKQSYKYNRTPENKANLVTALAVLEASVSEAQRNLSEVK